MDFKSSHNCTHRGDMITWCERTYIRQVLATTCMRRVGRIHGPPAVRGSFASCSGRRARRTLDAATHAVRQRARVAPRRLDCVHGAASGGAGEGDGEEDDRREPARGVGARTCGAVPLLRRGGLGQAAAAARIGTVRRYKAQRRGEFPYPRVPLSCVLQSTIAVHESVTQKVPVARSTRYATDLGAERAAGVNTEHT